MRFEDPHCSLACALALALAVGVSRPASAETGAILFEQKCASCHGADGQGVADGYEEPLFGDHSVAELARLIEETMPEEDPEACVDDEARRVAEYIYHEFYSPEARRAKGLADFVPRVELLRLTVRQHRNAVADLVGHFTPDPSTADRRRERQEDDGGRSIQPGLWAEYYQSKGMSKADRRVQQRVDSRIDFDFGKDSPAEGITADQFAIIWQGTLVARETGHYEFRVRTGNGARLYLNNDPIRSRRKLRDDSSAAGQSALIDAWVSSGKMRERSARVFLLGGRHYPLRLEFFKYKEELASVQLEWKPPHGTWSVLDHNHLTTSRAPRTFVVEAPFPADDRSLGYERGSSVSRQWQAASTAAAVATAAEVVNRLPLLAHREDDTPDRQEKLREFVVRFARIAFRRPLSRSEDQWFREVPFSDVPNVETAVRRAIVLILSSPHFLYTDLTSPGQVPGQHAIASRLSLALWDSIPDEPLRTAASNQQLNTPEQIQAHARRMLADPRARAKMRGFFRHWLELDERDLGKDKDMFPEFDERVMADLRYSLEQFVDQVLWSETSDYRELLQADYLLLNDRLRDVYQPQSGESGQNPTAARDDSEARADTSSDEGSEGPADAAAPGGSDAGGDPEPEFQHVLFSPNQRAGVLTHPYLLSAFAYHDNSSPIHRGVFLTRNIVGRSLKPPPVAVAFKNDEFAPDLTMREKITQLTRDKACMSCHSVINPLGFALENYDAVGRWRTSENNKPINSKGKYTTTEGQPLEVQSARDIANFAAVSPFAHRAFVTQVFHHLVTQDPEAYGPQVVDQLLDEFAENDFNMQHLMAKIAVLAATSGHIPSSPSKAP